MTHTSTTILVAAALGCAALSPAAAQTAPPAAGAIQTIVPFASGLVLDARYLRASRVTSGYRLAGQALVKDACTVARFVRIVGNVFPPAFRLEQSRRPGTEGSLCIEHLTWVVAQPLTVTSAAPPRYVNVNMNKGTTRVPLTR